MYCVRVRVRVRVGEWMGGMCGCLCVCVPWCGYNPGLKHRRERGVPCRGVGGPQHGEDMTTAVGNERSGGLGLRGMA